MFCKGTLLRICLTVVMCVVCYVARDEGTVAACRVVYGYLLRIRLTVVMCVVCYVARDEGTVAACRVVYG